MSTTYDGRVVQQRSADVGQLVCVHSHMTTCRLWYRCLQLTMMQLQQGEAGTDDAGEPAAPAVHKLLT